MLQQKHHLNRIFKEQKLEKYSLSLHGGRLLGLYYYYYYYYYYDYDYDYYLLSFCFVYNSIYLKGNANEQCRFCRVMSLELVTYDRMF